MYWCVLVSLPLTSPPYSLFVLIPTSTFDSLLCQSFFGSLTPVVCEKMVCGQKNQTTYQIDVPLPFVGHPFILLFRAFNARNVSVLALYRAKHADDKSSLPFVFLCPPPESIIREGDRAFVFCNPHRLEHSLETCLENPFKKGAFEGTKSVSDTTVPY